MLAEPFDQVRLRTVIREPTRGRWADSEYYLGSVFLN